MRIQPRCMAPHWQTCVPKDAEVPGSQLRDGFTTPRHLAISAAR